MIVFSSSSFDKSINPRLKHRICDTSAYTRAIAVRLLFAGAANGMRHCQSRERVPKAPLTEDLLEYCVTNIHSEPKKGSKPSTVASNVMKNGEFA
jgi:hypothetical protein